MTLPRAPIFVLVLWASLVLVRAQSNGEVQINLRSVDPQVYLPDAGLFMASNSVVALITYTASNGVSSNAVLMADRVSWNTNTGDAFAEGAVRIQLAGETLEGDRLHFNYQTQQMDWNSFRAGEMPYFAAGTFMTATGLNGPYSVTNALVTTDDYSNPLQMVRASEITFVPRKYVEGRNATLYVSGVPVFYLPYFHWDLTHSRNHFSFVPGYRGTFGAYLLSSYDWTLNDNLSGALHADYRALRGAGVGPDFDYNLGRWGNGTIKYYFAHDNDPGTDPNFGTPLPTTRQRALLTYSGTPLTNLTLMSQVAYQTDPFIVRDFFESEYEQNTQPNTFFDGDQVWRNWSLDVLAQPRVDPFFETVERLPDARFTGFRQQIFDTPLYYESESSLGYYRRLYANTNAAGADFYGGRADTFQQITMPETFFGFLNVTPRAGGRYTYYGPATGPGATTTNESRWVFNTGAEVSTKASQTWPGLRNNFLEMDGLRHIIEPSVNYVYIPRPNVLPNQLPQFDYELTNTLRLLPLEFPDYNDIDSIDSQNTIRFGLNNLLQTKRAGVIENFVDWDVMMDWHLRPRTNETTFSDIFSDFQFKPRSWLTFNSQTRFDIDTGRFNLAQDSFTFQPNNTWNWTVGQFYLRDNTNAWGTGNDLFTSTFFYRFNQNWGTRLAHYFDARTGTLQEQDYSIYRDMRSWTAALTFRELNNQANGHEFAVAATFSFKAFPRFKQGDDTVNAASLIGY